MFLSAALLLLYNNNTKNDFSALFLVFFAIDICSFANTHSMTTRIRYKNKGTPNITNKRPQEVGEREISSFLNRPYVPGLPLTTTRELFTGHRQLGRWSGLGRAAGGGACK